MSCDDEGLAAPRTRLAWWRSSLGMTTLLLLLIKLGLASVLPLIGLLGVLYVVLRGFSVSGTLQSFGLPSSWRHLWLSVTVVFVGIWFLIAQ
ncbi:MAG: hypothetical protein XXXJIFNMEKO3_01740 [Candidatus Erwinia impunctatus]|nr:hypothetical protein XXXJIFNMEKO_01740 [Culicoides impunctatus]